MTLALEQARLALPQDVPVGAVIVRDQEVVAAGCNLREREHSALGHAETAAIAAACAHLGRWSLQGCTLYVTLEPCPMCAGAIVQARIDRVVFGAFDPKAGACGSVLNLFEERFNHHPRLYRGPLERECQEILQDFFQGLREDGAGENG